MPAIFCFFAILCLLMKSACMCDILIIHSCKCVFQEIQKQKEWYPTPIDRFFLLILFQTGEIDLHLPRLHPQTWSRDILLDPMFSEDPRCKIITIMHAIWSSRNRRTHDEDGYDPVQSIKVVHETLSIPDIPSRRKAHGA